MRGFINATLLASASCIALSSAPAMAASFINGGFEDGTFSGWTLGTGYRGDTFNPLAPSDFLPGGSLNTVGLQHSAVIANGYVDPHVGSLLGATTYGNTGYAARIEDTTTGGYASVIQQKVTNYTDPSIFFAYKAVLDGAHGALDAASLEIRLIDATTNTTVISRSYNAASGGSGVDPQFSFDSTSGAYYNSTWQVVQLNTPTAGHDYLLQVLAADCQPTGHYGYVYLDGFGAVAPPSTVPLPASLPMFGLSILTLGGTAGLMRRRRRTTGSAA